MLRRSSGQFLASSRLRRAPMTKSQRSKRLFNSNSVADNEDHPSRSTLKLRPKSSPILVKSKPKLKPESPLIIERPIVKSLELDFQNLTILGPDFYSIDPLDLAPLLLGKFLRRDDVVLQIMEVEAYRSNDSACHGRFGITARTAPVFGPGGHAYVYLCYGLHMMLNIVADKEGVGAAVLIRSCAPVSGLTTIQQRRGQITDKPVLLTGPGKVRMGMILGQLNFSSIAKNFRKSRKILELYAEHNYMSMQPELVGQALGLSTEWSNHPLYVPGGLELLDGPKPEKILVGPRVGIDYAEPEHVNALWRFAVAGTPWISAPKNTLRPP